MSTQSDTELLEATFDAFWQAAPASINPDEIADAAAELTRSLARQPAVGLRRMTRMTAEQMRVLAGQSDITPDKGDRRFADEWFTSKPVYKALAQSYLNWNREIRGMFEDLDLDQKTRLNANFMLNVALEAAAPTNTLLGNPAALKEAVGTKGKSLVQGLRNAVDDMKNNGGMPKMVDSEPFVLGETVAATPGAVVYRDEILELIQYTPTTAKVRQRPMVVVPPQINKFYILDLAPGRSLVEHLVNQGQQVFMISWRNPQPEHREWDLDDYITSITAATDAAMSIAGTSDLNMLGVCAGGITASTAQAYFAAKGDNRIRSASYLVTVLDWDVPSPVGSIMSAPMIELARTSSESSGVLSGEELAKLFAWLRPNDLIWNYWANNYLMGKKPPAFDVLSWNCDATNMPAGLHHDFLDIAEGNTLTKANETVVLDTPLDLQKVDCPSYVVGAITDHITPWKACYETVNILGGESEFVLSSQGHIQALVNPSGNPKGKYFTNTHTPQSADEWEAGATEHQGSWWDHWATWLDGHGGRKVNAQPELGNTQYPVGDPAPGMYVHECASLSK